MADHDAGDVTKVAITRAWTDLSPKVIAFLTGSGVVVVATYIAGLFDITLAGWQIGLITLLAGGLAGYIKKGTIAVPSLAESSAAQNAALGAPAVVPATLAAARAAQNPAPAVDEPVSFDPPATQE
jgi:hypothetical protein